MNTPLRLLFFIDSLNYEAGTENQLIEMIARIDKTRFELFVACLEDGNRLRRLPATPLVFPIHRNFYAETLPGARS